MTLADATCILTGLAGFLFGIRCYLELWRWARQCQHARIAIACKRKVQLQAPLIEWLMWVNQLDRDEMSTGRVVYKNKEVTVAITKAVIPPGKVRQAISRVRRWRA